MAVIQTERLLLRPLSRRDKRQWDRVRKENRNWLIHWEATIPETSDWRNPESAKFSEMIKLQKIEAKAGRTYSFGIFLKNEFIGQVTLGGIIYGALRAGHIGYWISEKYANKGLTTESVIGVSEFGFKELELHRLEINVRPENAPSIKVAEKAGFILEGERKNYLHIDGAWRNHLCFVSENPLIR
jgi:ribosomal-protein-alanine N-acetyltransferase